MGRMWSVSAVRDAKVDGRDHVGRNEEHAKQRDSRGTLKRLVPAQIRGERPLQLERSSGARLEHPRGLPRNESAC